MIPGTVLRGMRLIYRKNPGRQAVRPKGEKMTKLSRAHEKEEKRRISKGLTTSIIALLLCWLPVVGLILAAVGFIGIMGSITIRHKKRFVLSLIASILILIICVGMLTFEVFAYSRDPNILENTGTWLLEVITGEYADDYNYMGGEDYSGDFYQGLGMNDDLYSEGFFDAEGNFVSYGN